jgi:hypothetical protein
LGPVGCTWATTPLSYGSEPDARTHGVWVPGASARPDAAHSSADVMSALVEGVIGSYG